MKQVMSCRQFLTHVGSAIEVVTAKGEVRTGDMGGSSSTQQMTRAVIAAL